MKKYLFLLIVLAGAFFAFQTKAATITTSAPVKDEKIKLGSTYTIKWTGGSADSKINIMIYGYNASTGTNFNSAIDSSIANTGSYTWNTSAQLTPNSFGTAVTKVVPGSYYIVVSISGTLDYGSTGFFTIYDTDTAVKLPIGNFDFVQNGKMVGWALDPDLPNQSVQVHYYFDGPAGSGKLGLVNTAGIRRDDVNKATGFFASYGFDIPVPEAYKDGLKHTVYAYAIDLGDSNKNTLLSGSPKTFTFAAQLTEWNDGMLFIDQGTIYVISDNKKWGFTSMDVFNWLGYKTPNLRIADTSNIPVGGFISSSNTRHLRGATVLINGTVYFMGKDFRYAFPSSDIFLSWGQKFENVLAGNEWDKAVPVGPAVQKFLESSDAAQRDARRIADIRMIMTALELYYNDCGGYPLNLNSLVVGSTKYLIDVPINPIPGGGSYTYYYFGSLDGGNCSGVYSSYSLTFTLEENAGGYTAGNHVASPSGIH